MGKNRPKQRGESDLIHDDFPDTEEDRVMRCAFSVLDILYLMPQSRLAKRGREWLLTSYNITEADLAKHQPLWELSYGKFKEFSNDNSTKDVYGV